MNYFLCREGLRWYSGPVVSDVQCLVRSLSAQRELGWNKITRMKTCTALWVVLDRVPRTQLWPKQAAVPALTRYTFKSYKQNPKQINAWLCQEQNKNLHNGRSIDRGTIIFPTHQVSLAGLRKVSIRILRSQVSASKDKIQHWAAARKVASIQKWILKSPLIFTAAP